MEALIIFGAKHLFLLSPLILTWLFFKKSAKERGEMFLLGLFSLPLTYLLGLFARALYFNPRPFVEEGLIPLIQHSPDNGFPSDHVLLLAALASLSFPYDKKLSALLWSIALLSGISRVLAGVHHLIDIVGSIVIALISSALVYFVLNLRKKV